MKLWRAGLFDVKFGGVWPAGDGISKNFREVAAAQGVRRALFACSSYTLKDLYFLYILQLYSIISSFPPQSY
jgi:hypothetical protein